MDKEHKRGKKEREEMMLEDKAAKHIEEMFIRQLKVLLYKTFSVVENTMSNPHIF